MKNVLCVAVRERLTELGREREERPGCEELRGKRGEREGVIVEHEQRPRSRGRRAAGTTSRRIRDRTCVRIYRFLIFDLNVE